VETLRALQALHADWRARVENAKLRSRVVARALDLLLEHPVLTARMLQQAAGCSHVAANTALAELKRLGVLTVQGTPRRRRYIAHEMLRLLQTPM
jgi:Fic family protein